MEENLADNRDSKGGFAEGSAEKRRKFDKALAVSVSSKTMRDIPHGAGFINNICRMLEKNGVLGEYKNSGTGWNIAYSEKSARNVLNHFAGDRGVALTEHVPALIESAVYLETTRKNVKGLVSHIFAAKATFDGEESVIGFVVRDDANGKRYYVHDIMTDVGLKADDVTDTWRKTTSETPPETAGSNPQSIHNIVKKHLGVKGKDKNLSELSGGGNSDTP